MLEDDGDEITDAMRRLIPGRISKRKVNSDRNKNIEKVPNVEGDEVSTLRREGVFESRNISVCNFVGMDGTKKKIFMRSRIQRQR